MNQPSQPGSALTAADLSEYLATADDFAFEREVYHVAHRLGFETEHAALYKDPVTGKPRQFDIRASFTSADNKIALAIECKGLTPDYPLLVSCVPRAHSEAYHEVLESGERINYIADAYTKPTRFVRTTQVASDQHPCIYPAGHGQGVGKSMRQVKRETRGDRRGQMVGGDDVFDKWTQALASLAEIIDDGAEELRRISQPPQSLHQIAFLPVLVVSDGALWVADYSSEGAIQREPFQVAELTYFLGRKYPLEPEGTSLTITHLHIITRCEVRSWLHGISQGGGIWQELFPR